MKYYLKVDEYGAGEEGNYLMLNEHEKWGRMLHIGYKNSDSSGESSDDWKRMVEFSEDDIALLPEWCQYLTRKEVEVEDKNAKKSG